MAARLRGLIAGTAANVLGPAPLFRLRGRSRSQLVIKCRDRLATVLMVAWLIVLAASLLVPWAYGERVLAARWSDPAHAIRVWQVPSIDAPLLDLEEDGVRTAYASLQFATRLALESGERLVVSQAWNERIPGDPLRFRDEVVELLHWVGLGDRMWALPPVLSGGEKQRAAIARAVIARPQLLLADEPTGNVDPNLGQRLLRLFVELNKSGTSIVIATHDIALMDQYDARRLVLHEGRLHVYD